MTQDKIKVAFLALILAGATLSRADSTAYSEAGVLTTFSNIGQDLDLEFSNYDSNEYYNGNTPPSYGTYTNTPSDSSSPTDQYAPNIITANITSTATGYAYTGWVNENESVYGIYNGGSVAETITVSSTCYAIGNDGVSGSGGSPLYSSVAAITEDFTGQGNWGVSAQVLSTDFATYGLEGTSATGTTTITVDPNQTLDFVAYDYDITEAYSNPAPEPVSVGFLGASFIGLALKRRAKRSGRA